jgi:hypothetical protein
MKRKTLIAMIGRTLIAMAMAGMVMPASAAVHRTVKEHKFLVPPMERHPMADWFPTEPAIFTAPRPAAA